MKLIKLLLLLVVLVKLNSCGIYRPVDAREFPIEIRGDLWLRSQNFQVNRDWIRFNGVVQNVGFSNICFVGMHLVADITMSRFTIQPDPRFGKGKLVSCSDVRERIESGLAAWDALLGREN